MAKVMSQQDYLNSVALNWAKFSAPGDWLDQFFTNPNQVQIIGGDGRPASPTSVLADLRWRGLPIKPSWYLPVPDTYTATQPATRNPPPSTPSTPTVPGPVAPGSTAIGFSASKNLSTNVTTAVVHNMASCPVTFVLATSDALFLGPYTLGSGATGTYTAHSALTYSIGLIKVTLANGSTPSFPNGVTIKVATSPPPPASAPPPVSPPGTGTGWATPPSVLSTSAIRANLRQAAINRKSGEPVDPVSEYLELKVRGPAPGSAGAHQRTLHAWLTRKRGGHVAPTESARERLGNADLQQGMRTAFAEERAANAQEHLTEQHSRERHEALDVFKGDTAKLDAYMAARKAGTSHAEAMAAARSAGHTAPHDQPGGAAPEEPSSDWLAQSAERRKERRSATRKFQRVYGTGYPGRLGKGILTSESTTSDIEAYQELKLGGPLAGTPSAHLRSVRAAATRKLHGAPTATERLRSAPDMTGMTAEERRKLNDNMLVAARTGTFLEDLTPRKQRALKRVGNELGVRRRFTRRVGDRMERIEHAGDMATYARDTALEVAVHAGTHQGTEAVIQGARVAGQIVRALGIG